MCTCIGEKKGCGCGEYDVHWFSGVLLICFLPASGLVSLTKHFSLDVSVQQLPLTGKALTLFSKQSTDRVWMGLKTTDACRYIPTKVWNQSAHHDLRGWGGVVEIKPNSPALPLPVEKWCFHSGADISLTDHLLSTTVNNAQKHTWALCRLRAVFFGCPWMAQGMNWKLMYVRNAIQLLYCF